MKKILSVVVVLLSVITMSAKDIKTVVLTTSPKMVCENCEKKITENLRYVRGVKSIEASAEKQTVTVTYDADKTSVEKLQESLKKINYTATEKTCGKQCGPSSSKQCAKSAGCEEKCEKQCEKKCCAQGEKTCCKTENK